MWTCPSCRRQGVGVREIGKRMRGRSKPLPPTDHDLRDIASLFVVSHQMPPVHHPAEGPLGQNSQTVPRSVQQGLTYSSLPN